MTNICFWRFRMTILYTRKYKYTGQWFWNEMITRCMTMSIDFGKSISLCRLNPSTYFSQWYVPIVWKWMPKARPKPASGRYIYIFVYINDAAFFLIIFLSMKIILLTFFCFSRTKEVINFLIFNIMWTFHVSNV